eukprot:6464881-Amphidinium_carterae.3
MTICVTGESTDDPNEEGEGGKGEPVPTPSGAASKWDAETQTLRAERNFLRQVEALKGDLGNTRVLMTDTLATFRALQDVQDQTLTSPTAQTTDVTYHFIQHCSFLLPVTIRLVCSKEASSFFLALNSWVCLETNLLVTVSHKDYASEVNVVERRLTWLEAVLETDDEKLKMLIRTASEVDDTASAAVGSRDMTPLHRS